jgi:hypothetical protein
MKYNFPYNFPVVPSNLIDHLDSGQWKTITAIDGITWGDLSLPENSDHLRNIIAIIRNMNQYSLKTAYYIKLLELIHIDKGDINFHVSLEIDHY